MPARAGANSIKSKRTGEARSYIVYRCSADQAGHSTILKHVLDNRVRAETIHALWLKKGKPERPHDHADEATLIGLNTELAKANAGLQALADALGALTVTAENARMTSTRLNADVERLTREIGEITNHAATVGTEDATWEAIWGRADPTRPDTTPNEDGTQTVHVTSRMLRRMTRTA